MKVVLMQKDHKSRRVDMKLPGIPELIKYDDIYWFRVHGTPGGAMYDARAWYRQISTFEDMDAKVSPKPAQ